MALPALSELKKRLARLFAFGDLLKIINLASAAPCLYLEIYIGRGSEIVTTLVSERDFTHRGPSWFALQLDDGRLHVDLVVHLLHAETAFVG